MPVPDGTPPLGRSDVAFPAAAGGGLGTAIAGLAQLLPAPWPEIGAIVAPGAAILIHAITRWWIRRTNYRNAIKWLQQTKSLLNRIVADSSSSQTHRDEARRVLEQLDWYEVALTLGQINVSIRPPS